jgi:hypothetical protein
VGEAAANAVSALAVPIDLLAPQHNDEEQVMKRQRVGERFSIAIPTATVVAGSNLKPGGVVRFKTEQSSRSVAAIVLPCIKVGASVAAQRTLDERARLVEQVIGVLASPSHCKTRRADEQALKKRLVERDKASYFALVTELGLGRTQPLTSAEVLALKKATG